MHAKLILAAATTAAILSSSTFATVTPINTMTFNGRSYQMLDTVSTLVGGPESGGTTPQHIAVGPNAPAYTQTSTTGLTFSSGSAPDGLDDVGLAPGTAAVRPILTNLVAGYARTAATTAGAAVVFVDFYNVVNPASAGVVESNYLGGFGGNLTIAAGAANSAASFSFSGLNTLTTPIAFTDDSIGVEISFADATGNAYSTTLTNLSSTPGVPTLGSSVTGYYRDAGGDDFQATDLQPTLGNLYLSLNTAAAVPEPTTLGALAGLGAIVARRRRR